MSALMAMLLLVKNNISLVSCPDSVQCAIYIVILLTMRGYSVKSDVTTIVLGGNVPH